MSYSVRPHSVSPAASSCKFYPTFPSGDHAIDVWSGLFGHLAYPGGDFCHASPVMPLLSPYSKSFTM
jgi:hypothetical protein